METVLIADDHRIVRLVTRMIIESLPQKYNLIETSTVAEVMQILSSQPVQFAVLDIFLEDGNVFTAIQQIPDYFHQTNILVYSMNAEKIYARRLIQQGVRGFLCKQASIQELESAIRSLLKGENYLSESFKKALFDSAKKGVTKNPIDLLSDRELEVVEYIATGLGSKEISAKLNLDITTVSTYRRRAFEKLDVQNMIELKEKFQLYKMQE